MVKQYKGYVVSATSSYAYVSPTGNTSRYQFGRMDVRSGDFAKISVGDYVSFEVAEGTNRARNVRIIHDRK